MERKPSDSPNLMRHSAGAASAASTPGRRWAQIAEEKPKPKLAARVTEAAGETVAECAAVLCCCPCGLANLFFVAAVKLPAGLVRRALRLRRKRRAGYGKVKAGILRTRVGSFDDDDFSIHHGTFFMAMGAKEVWPAKAVSPELLQLEKEMTARFYSTGFWRSPSQKE
ncbi:uncharacterized protein LOC135637991 [Musa acuminata AAA Group]|uniref:(wild Malaysian banana) hypothetical protein n=1 Tax=Musa acuminata subsp. malaccensis TaxID=214687 RepID=A0A804IGP7_MUSAM|nr:PREDICTED: uncharacterized protein LOC103979537 [Musa acuminata subsp. malaccensis]CAG1851391.1 unnamed protein product [Musa acuminata subsp. malaccensis]